MTDRKERVEQMAALEASGQDVTELRIIDGLLNVLEGLETLIRDGDDIKEHSHQCPNKACGLVWHHDRSKLSNEEEAYDKAHTCPKCGGKQRRPYIGPKPPACFYDGIDLKEEAA